jgi:hypothetical protein
LRRYSRSVAATPAATGATGASVDEQLAAASAFLKEFSGGTARQRARRLPKAPMAAIQTAALRDPDPFARRGYLWFLDHYANDDSMDVFAAALADPVPFVRTMALHSLACESCKADGLCAAEVVPVLIEFFESDSNSELRSKAVPLLARLAGRDPRARGVLRRAAADDGDPVIRRAAEDALAGRYVAPRKRYERRERRHARTARRPSASAR